MCPLNAPPTPEPLVNDRYSDGHGCGVTSTSRQTSGAKDCSTSPDLPSLKPRFCIQASVCHHTPEFPPHHRCHHCCCCFFVEARLSLGPRQLVKSYPKQTLSLIQVTASMRDLAFTAARLLLQHSHGGHAHGVYESVEEHAGQALWFLGPPWRRRIGGKTSRSMYALQHTARLAMPPRLHSCLHICCSDHPPIHTPNAYANTSCRSDLTTFSVISVIFPL